MIKPVDIQYDPDRKYKICVGCGETCYNQPVTNDPSLVRGQLDPNWQTLCGQCNDEYVSVVERIIKFACSN